MPRPKSQGDQPLAELNNVEICEYSIAEGEMGYVVDDSMEVVDLQGLISNQETFKSMLVSRYDEKRIRTATPPLTCGNQEDDYTPPVNKINLDMQLSSFPNQRSSQILDLKKSRKSGGERKSISANRNSRKSSQQPPKVTIADVDLNIEGKNLPTHHTFKEIVTLTQDLNYLIQKKYKMPKHMIILG